LTGVDADRLPEEKRRGITIDIGFADLDLGEVKIGFVDVPGHERFVKNMLAGAHGIDAVALVIAADESVMPQTREHFQICRLLGVRSGLVVLTKKDLVDEELLAVAQAEAKELVAGSFLEDAPVVGVSSRTGEGIDELKSALREIGLQVPARSTEFITRLPIDRAFTMRGFGAVVTGTLIAGEISEGEELELLPSGTRVRVRGLQVHGTSTRRAMTAQRTAVNLGGIETAAIERGMVLATTARLRPTQIVDAEVQMLSEAPRPLRSRQRVRVHIGAAEVLARVRVLEAGNEIKPGTSGFAQLRFESPIVGVLGDRFILRSYSPQMTIGGGMIVDAFAAKRRAREVPAAREWLAGMLIADRAAQVALFTTQAGAHGLRRLDLAARTGWRDKIIEGALAQAKESREIIDAEGVLLSPVILEELKQKIMRDVAAHHAREPLSRGLPKEILRERHFAHAPIEVFRAALAALEKEGAITAEQEIVRSREHSRELSGDDARLRDRLEAIYREGALSAPSMAEAFALANLGAAARQHGRKILQTLIDAGVVVRVHGEMFFHRQALDDLIMKLRAHASRNSDRAIDVAAFKELAGISRKYAIPLLEYLDRQHVTRREGDQRVIL